MSVDDEFARLLVVDKKLTGRLRVLQATNMHLQAAKRVLLAAKGTIRAPCDALHKNSEFRPCSSFKISAAIRNRWE